MRKVAPARAGVCGRLDIGWDFEQFVRSGGWWCLVRMGKEPEQHRGKNVVTLPLGAIGGKSEKTQWGETVEAHRIL